MFAQFIVNVVLVFFESVMIKKKINMFHRGSFREITRRIGIKKKHQKLCVELVNLIRK